MRISNRVKRNISLTLSIVGFVCIASQIWDVALAPSSGRAWFDLFSKVLLTYLCFDNYLIYRRRVKTSNDTSCYWRIISLTASFRNCKKEEGVSKFENLTHLHSFFKQLLNELTPMAMLLNQVASFLVVRKIQLQSAKETHRWEES